MFQLRVFPEHTKHVCFVIFFTTWKCFLGLALKNQVKQVACNCRALCLEMIILILSSLLLDREQEGQKLSQVKFLNCVALNLLRKREPF